MTGSFANDRDHDMLEFESVFPSFADDNTYDFELNLADQDLSYYYINDDSSTVDLSTAFPPDSNLLEPAIQVEDLAEDNATVGKHKARTSSTPTVPHQDHGTYYLDQHSTASDSDVLDFHEPRGWMSVTSPAGVTWVQQRTGNMQFKAIAADLASIWTSQPHLDRNVWTSSTPEPTQEVLWRYCNAFFDQSLNTIFEAVHRADFENRLRTHLDSNLPDTDPAWYALRNAVYASGCRLYHSASCTATFINTQTEAQGYFSNALSAHSELLLRSPCLDAVRALLAMTFFAEGLGSPSLGSGLVANAAFLAQALGLHRKPPTKSLVSDSTMLQRTWLFWSIYCFEKSIARRLGRPSIIDDDEIACDVPSATADRSSIDAKFMSKVIRSCQISSGIGERLMRANSTPKAVSEFLNYVSATDQELLALESEALTSMAQSDARRLVSESVLTLRETILRSSIYDITMMLHGPLVYPWAFPRLQRGSNPSNQTKLTQQTLTSTRRLIESARGVVVMAKNFEINGSNTHAFMIDYPMHAFINIFIHVIGAPGSASARTDLALLEVVAGHFGRMDFVTRSNLSFPFTRDIAKLARRAVETRCEGISSEV